MAVATEAGIDFTEIRYLKDPPDRAMLERIVAGLEDPVADLVRKDSNFSKLELDADGYTSAEAVIGLLLEHPKLMQRPVVVKGTTAIIGRPTDRVRQLLL